MIDEGQGGEEFKRSQRQKLDALLALAEAHDCRRVRLLAYFDETSGPCGNCDNCLTPPSTWDGTLAAQKVLSCVARFYNQNRGRFGVGHLIDVLRGKETEKVTDYRHQLLSTFGIGKDLSEAEWRSVIRQLIAAGHLSAEGEFSTLSLTSTAWGVMKGEQRLAFRKASEGRRARSKGTRKSSSREPALPLDAEGHACFSALKEWRAGVAREHNMPAYVVFHDATLIEMARLRPSTLNALSSVSGVGAKKLETYGPEILRVLSDVA
jgi:ATP-dependent DNA helicase RecQ